jgi:hypothetical protein
MKEPKEKALALAEKLGVKLTSEEKENDQKQLLKVIITGLLFLVKCLSTSN